MIDAFLLRRVKAAPPLTVEAGHSGYFSKPLSRLDPQLFTGDHFKPAVRQDILDRLYRFWDQHYNDPQAWSTVWVAGSGASYQWHADRGGVGDLDVLVGVDMSRFIKHNPHFGGIPEPLIAKRFNAEFQTLMATTKRWVPPGGRSAYEMTFYVNPGAADIRDIQPYAAYDLSRDEWTVRPITLPDDWGPHSIPPSWEIVLSTETASGRMLVSRWQQAAQQAQQAAPGSPQASTAAAALRHATEAAAGLYEDIHSGRKNAFASSGEGYRDFYNFRWQAHKMAGTEQALRFIHDLHSQALKDANMAQYGEADLSTNKAVLDASLVPHGIRGL